MDYIDFEKTQRRKAGDHLASIRGLLATAEKEHRELNAAEAETFDRLATELKIACANLNMTFAARDGGSHRELYEAFERRFSEAVNPHTPSDFRGEDYGTLSASPEEWRDTQTGKTVRLLRKGESLAECQRHTFGLQTPDYGIGTICRALALGPQNDLEKRALAEGTQSAGGYMVPTIVSAQLIDAMRSQAAVFQAGARTITLENNQMTIARVETDPTASWRNEAAAIAESDPVFSQIAFTSRALAFYFKVSRELLQDAVNLDQAIQTVIAGAMARALDYGCLKGSGTPPEIRGVANVTGVGSYSMGANGLTLANYDPFIQAVKLLIDANVPLSNVGAFVMATRTFAQAALLKEATTNAPLARPELIRNATFIPTTLLPVNETQGTSSDCSRIIVGDWPQMLIGARLPVTVSTLVERFADTGQIGFVAFARYDMQLAHAAAFAQVIGLKG